MLGILYSEYGTVWTIIAVGGICIFIVLGFAIDYRFFVLTLIWLFLFIPLVVAFLYFFYGMNPLTAFNSIPHKIIFNPDEVRVRIIEKKSEEEAAQEDPSKDFIVRKVDYKNMKRGSDYVLLFFNHSGILWLPVYGFDSIDQFKNVLEGFKKN